MGIGWRLLTWFYLHRFKVAVWTLVVSVGGLLGYISIQHPPIDSGDWAAWAQAFGAVLALGAAIWMQHAAAYDQTRKANSAAMVLAFQLSEALVDIESACFTEQAEEAETAARSLIALRALAPQIRLDALDDYLIKDYMKLVSLVERADAHADLLRRGKTSLHHLASLFSEDRQTCRELIHSMQAAGASWHSGEAP